MLFASNAQVITSSTDKMMDFDNILDIASQNQGVSNVQVQLSFAVKCLTLNDNFMNTMSSCNLSAVFHSNFKNVFIFPHGRMCSVVRTSHFCRYLLSNTINKLRCIF